MHPQPADRVPGKLHLYPSRAGLCLAFGVLGFGCYTQISSSKGLLAHWTFDECRASDATGHGHEGQIFGSSCVDGAHKKALFFDSTSSVVVRETPALDLTRSLTISCWLHPTRLQSNAFPTVLSKHRGVTPGAQYQLGLATTSKGSQLRFCSEPDTGCVIGNGYLTDEDWNHVVVTFDASNLSYYINGAEDLQMRAPGRLRSYPAHLAIGATSYNSWGFHGAIDEVRIYDRALSAAEVGRLYGQMKPSSPTPSTRAAFPLTDGESRREDLQ
jgi:hypothetical protein